MASKDSTIIKEELIPLSTIETIDESLFKYIDETLDLHVQHREDFRKVPVIWQSAERAFHRKTHLDIRASSGELKLPIISVFRSEIMKDPARKGAIQANIPPVNDAQGGAIAVTRVINQEKTSNFANAMANRLFDQDNFPFRNDQKVYYTVTAPLPVYVNINYEINIKTQYLQHINHLITPFITKPGQISYFVFGGDVHKYEAFVDPSFNLESNASDIGGEEKTYQTKISINVLGHLMGEGPNQEQPKLVYRENAVQIFFGREESWPRIDFGNHSSLADGGSQPWPGHVFGIAEGGSTEPISVGALDITTPTAEEAWAQATQAWPTLSAEQQVNILDTFASQQPGGIPSYNSINSDQSQAFVNLILEAAGGASGYGGGGLS